MEHGYGDPWSFTSNWHCMATAPLAMALKKIYEYMAGFSDLVQGLSEEPIETRVIWVLAKRNERANPTV